MATGIARRAGSLASLQKADAEEGDLLGLASMRAIADEPELLARLWPRILQAADADLDNFVKSCCDALTLVCNRPTPTERALVTLPY